MSSLTAGGTLLAAETVSNRPGRRSKRRPGRVGLAFVSLYTLLLLAFGILPTGYAIFLAFTNQLGQFVGFGQFVKVAQDYRFAGAFLNIAGYVVIWLVVLVVFTVGLALIIHQRARFVSTALRFLFYIPGALAGVASALVWLFMLDPTASPFSAVLQLFGLHTFAQVVLPSNLTVIFVIMAFWTGAGGWIVVMYGALNNIPDEIMDAAKVDGANAWQTAWRIQIPMISKWIAYMAILAFAAGTQLFVEPSLVASASIGAITTTWSPNQLAYTYAFTNNDFNGAAAISLDLLVLALAGAVLLVLRSGLFTIDEED
jgi:multiple sugar transport system permease protein